MPRYLWFRLLICATSVLDRFEEIKVCTGYKYMGDSLDSIPASADILAKVEPVYDTLPGWQTPTNKVRKYEDLPPNARRYVEYIDDFLGVRTKYIGTGPNREDLIHR